MLPYSREIILGNTNNYGIVKTETVFGFGPSTAEHWLNYNNTFNKSLDWILAPNGIEARTYQAKGSGRTSKSFEKMSVVESKTSTKTGKNGKNKKGKISKIRSYDRDTDRLSRKQKKKKHLKKFLKKFGVPFILGLLAAKSFLVPIALKALAYVATKGLLLGFFSTVVAAVLGIKGMSDVRRYDGKDDSKTQVEIIQVPAKSEDHIFYDEYNHHRNDGKPPKKHIF